MKPEDFEVHQAQAFAALERRKLAERDVVSLARQVEALPAGRLRIGLFEMLMDAVRKLNAAAADLLAAQQALDERARKR